MHRDEFQSAVTERARRLFNRVRETPPSIFNREWWSGKVMDWCMQNEDFKVQMFRFVDVLPYLTSSAAVARHLQEYFCGSEQGFPSALQWGLNCLSPDSMAARTLAKGVRANIVLLARQFITGATPQDALPNLRRIRKSGLAFTLDLLGEATLSKPEAEAYQRRYLELMETLFAEQARWPALGGEDFQLDWGVSPRVNISLKATSFNPRIHPSRFEASILETREMLRPIFRKAREGGAFVTLDVESYTFKDLALTLFKRLMEEDEFEDFSNAAVVVQAYLKDSERDVRELIRWVGRRKHPLSVRLVKGAYWDYEKVLAAREGWRVPVFEDKAATDANFENLAALILEHHDVLHLACASHNLRSIAFAMEYAAKLGLPRDAVEYQVLFGMAEPVRVALEGEGVPLRVYATVGELIPGMAYLVRRLLENTSNESFLRKAYAENIPLDVLIEDPRQRIPAPAGALPPEVGETRFANEPHLNWAERGSSEAFRTGLDKARLSLGRVYRVYLGGTWVETENCIASLNPAREKEVVGRICQSGARECEEAFKAAQEAFAGWRATPPERRAEVLFKAADLARRRRHELAGLQVLEVGKSWGEADADVTEAIDFLNYYGQEMIRLGRARRLLSPPGEVNRYFYQPRGIVAVIAPWNFPLAISMGMVSAALVAGNCVLYKPSSLAAAVGAALPELFQAAGLPAGVLSYLPGPGAAVGRALVEHPAVNVIAFTGSRDVGLEIVRKAAEPVPGQRHVKKVVAEMGGKNAIIVDADADLDEAVSGVLKSAFSFQGQKCSACSRVIVLGGIYERFLARLVPAAEALVLGDPADPTTEVGPVIDGTAREKTRSFIEAGKAQGRLLLLREGPGEGFFAPLAIFDGVDQASPLAQEEIFGPVLTLLRVDDLEEALQVANGVAYALTGGFYSRSPRNIQRVMEEFQVGNLYINRGITGALVGRQPFGGFKLSGVGSKTGGPDYLLQFMEPRSVTENTLRRGFAPEEG